MKRNYLFPAILLLLSIKLYGQENQIQTLDEVVVTDSRLPLKRKHSGKVVQKITSEDLEKVKGKTLPQILNTLAGIIINGSNSVSGQNLGYYFRGGRNKQVLVLIDGVAVSDQSAIANDFDLNLLTVNQIESIEIIKGAASTLYGANAATGVINITLKKPESNTFKASVNTQVSTNNDQQNKSIAPDSYTGALTLSGKANALSYLANFGATYTEGLSALSGEDFKANPFQKVNALVKLNYEFSDKLSVNTSGMFQKNKVSFDETFGFTDANNTARNTQKGVVISPRYSYNKGELFANISFQDFDRDFKETSFPSTFSAKSLTVDIFNKVRISRKLNLLTGINIQKHSADNTVIDFNTGNYITSLDADNATFTTVDPYITSVFVSDSGFNLNTGLRLNFHSEYNSYAVVNINPSYRFKLSETSVVKLISSFSSAYITPTLFQLFDPTYGNPDLKPEKNFTYEVGFEFARHNFLFNTTFFYREEKEAVIFYTINPVTFQAEYRNNVGNSFARGLETIVNWDITNKISWNANHTFINREKALMLQIPKHKISSTLSYNHNGNGIAVNYNYFGERLINFFPEVTDNSYSLIDIFLSKKILNDKLTLYGSVTNLFNETYTEIYRFSTLGRNFSVGVNYNLY